MSADLKISVAVPVHNEAAVLPESLRCIGGVLEGIPGGPHEMVFVDDGSTDRTLEILERAAELDPRIIVVVLSRNFGHQPALSAALEYATGDVVVIIDGDLQDPPEIIPELVKQFRQGYDVVYTQRKRRKEVWWLRLCFFLFYRLMARLSDIDLPLDAGDCGLMSRRVVDELRRMPEHNRYLRGMRTWVGFRQIGIPVERPERLLGESKYSPRSRLKFALDGIFAFSTVPIRAASLLGLCAMGLSGAYAIYTLYARLILHQTTPGFTALILTTTFLSGILLFFLGIIGEYVGRVYEEIKARPLYVVSKCVGHAFARREGQRSSPTSRSDGLDTTATRRFASATDRDTKG